MVGSKNNARQHLQLLQWMGNLVDSLLDFEEAWLNQSAQASDFEVNGENDEEVLASHANQDRVRKRSLVSSS
ncbi:hypothetical protein V6N13_059664 [Hibiscus sabdariffa]|uniref:Uncharacterized protein n=1 Tax=Hibiscus sabdariffa TaxID=183260 RepID=A0ABR1ZH49_9ROSI